MKSLHIAAGIIRNPQGDIFITQRQAHVHMAHKWEFPGGKLEAGESPAQALSRELWEEIDIRITNWSLFDVQSEYMAEKFCHMTLWFYLVTGWQGAPWGKEGQASRWVSQHQLTLVDFPLTNRPIVKLILSCDAVRLV